MSELIYQASETPVETIQALEESPETLGHITIIPGLDLLLSPRTVVVQRVLLDNSDILTPDVVTIGRVPIETDYWFLQQRTVQIKRTPIRLAVDYQLEAGNRLVTPLRVPFRAYILPKLVASSRQVQVLRTEANLAWNRIFSIGQRSLVISRRSVSGGFQVSFTFPSLRPTRRRFVPPQHGIRPSISQNGRKVRRLVGNATGAGQLDLSYQNIPDAAAAEILSIFDLHDRIKPVTLPEDVFSGSSGDLRSAQELASASGLSWYFRERPQIESVQAGISSVDVSFISQQTASAIYFPTVAEIQAVTDNSQSPVGVSPCAESGDGLGPGGPIELIGPWRYVFTALISVPDQDVTISGTGRDGDPPGLIKRAPDNVLIRQQLTMINGRLTLVDMYALSNGESDFTIPYLNVRERTYVQNGSTVASAQWPSRDELGLPDNFAMVVKISGSFVNGGACFNMATLRCPGMDTLREDGEARYGDVDPGAGTESPIPYSGQTIVWGWGGYPNSGTPTSLSFSAGPARSTTGAYAVNYVSGSYFNPLPGAFGAKVGGFMVTDGAIGFGWAGSFAYGGWIRAELEYMPREIANELYPSALFPGKY